MPEFSNAVKIWLVSLNIDSKKLYDKSISDFDEFCTVNEDKTMEEKFLLFVNNKHEQMYAPTTIMSLYSTIGKYIKLQYGLDADPVGKPVECLIKQWQKNVPVKKAKVSTNNMLSTMFKEL